MVFLYVFAGCSIRKFALFLTDRSIKKFYILLVILLKYIVLYQTTKGLLEFPDSSTATYCLVQDHVGEMYCAIGDMDIIGKIEPHNVCQQHKCFTY